MFDKLSAVEAQYEKLMTEMADPAVQADSAKFRAHSKTLSDIQPLVEHFREYKDLIAQITATEDLLKDPDMRELAQEELASLEARRDQLLADIKVLLVPKDPNTQRTSYWKSVAAPAATRRRCLRRISSGCTRGTRSGRGGASKC